MKASINLPLKLLLLVVLLLTGSSTQAEIKKTLGKWDVHYIAFNSTFLTPEVAKAYGIVRSENNTLINISIIDRQSGEAQHAQLSGFARNLIGTTINLDFKEVKEGEAIYYLATLSTSDEEHFRFVIDIQQGRNQQQLKFEQKVYHQ